MVFFRLPGTTTAALAMVLAAAGGIRAGERPVRVALEPVALAGWDDPRYRPVQLDARGEGAVPFATPSGKLAFRLGKDGLLVDRDGDGRIDERDGKPRRRGVFFPVLLSLGGRTFTVTIRVVTFTRERLLFACTWTALRGRIGPYRVVVTDRDFNGRFLDRGRDGIELRAGPAAAAGRVRVGQDRVLRSMIPLRGKLVEVAPHSRGTELYLAPYPGGTARVVVEPGKILAGASLDLAHRQGLWEGRAGSDAAALLPAGEYELTGARLSIDHELEGKPPFTWLKLPTVISFRSREDPRPARVVLREGINRLRPGPPFTLRFALRRRGDRLRLERVHLEGRLGVDYEPSIGGAKPGSRLDWFLEGPPGRRRLGPLHLVHGRLRGGSGRIPRAYRDGTGGKVVVRFRCPVIGEVTAARPLPPAGE